MSGWLIRRIAQAAFVVLLMTLIVFIGLHAIGNPIDILIGQVSGRSRQHKSFSL